MSEVTQYEGILTYVDAAGNETEMYPEVKTDESLTVSGKPADAKAVGDKITEAVKNAGAKAKTLTQEEYDALSEEEKANGIYVVPGGEDLTAKNLAYDGSVTGLGNNVQDAVDNVNKKVDEQNKNLGEKLDSTFVGTEEKVGTWFGVDLYRKCYESTGSYNSTVLLDNTINNSNINVVDFGGSCRLNDGEIRQFVQSYANGDYVTRPFVDSSGLKFRIENQYVTKINLIVYYTKVS